MSSSTPSSSISDQTLSFEFLRLFKNRATLLGAESSTPSALPLSSQHYACGCIRTNTLTDSEYGCRRQPKKVRRFKHRKAEPQEAAVCPTLKDVLFTLIMSVGIVMVIAKILKILASIYLTQQLGFFSSLEFWRRWEVCMRLSVLALWLGKLTFDVGNALGKADARRKLDRPLGTSCRSSP